MGSKVETAASEELSDSSPLLIRHGRMTVVNWETSDPEIVTFFEGKLPGSRTPAFEKAVKIGVVASNAAGTTERIDYVEKEFNILQTRFNEALDRTLNSLGERFDDAFGEKGKFAKLLEDTFGEKGKIVTEIFDPRKEGSPLQSLRVDLEKQLDALRLQVVRDKGREEGEQGTTKVGLQFEDDAENLLARLVRQRKGDRLERTTTVPGRLARSKKGDFLLRIAENPNAPIVIETKDVENASLPSILRTSNEAMENRGAAYSILVAKDVNALPAAVGWFNEFDGNKLVCAIGDSASDQLREEILNIALSWARIRVMTQRAKTLAIDAGQIEEAVNKVKDHMGRLKEVLTQCTNLENATGKIRSLCAEIGRDVTNQLNIVSAALKNSSNSDTGK